MTESELLFTPKNTEATALYQFGKAASENYGFTYREYQDLHRFSLERAEEFWHFFTRYHDVKGDFPEHHQGIIEAPNKMYGKQFFAGEDTSAKINFAENLLRHCTELADSPAIIFQSNQIEITLSWLALSEEVSKLQQALKAYGFGAGDVAAGFVPNAPIAVIAMLAVTSLGGVWTSCSPDFGYEGVKDRFGQTKPKILFAADGYYYNGKKHDCLAKIAEFTAAIDSITLVIIDSFMAKASGEKCDIEAANLKKNACLLDDFIQNYQAKPLEFIRRDFNDPLFIMYSSGTTGIPKCIIHGIGGVLLNLIKEHRLHSDIRSGDRVFYYTTCGWMMWNWLVTALASGATLLLYDESPLHPDSASLFDFIAKHRARFMGISAKYIDALSKHAVDIGSRHDLSALDFIGSTGSVLSPESFRYIYQHIKSELYVSSLSGGTDIVGCFVMGIPTRAVYCGEIAGAALGMAIEVCGADGKDLPSGEKGELVCAQVFPNMPIGFFNDSGGSKYHKAYFARFADKWHHGDFIARTAHDGFVIYGRSDATLNPGGVRIGTAEIYRAVEPLPQIKEAICVGQDFAGDVRVVLFVILSADEILDETLIKEIKQTIKHRCTPRHVPTKILAVTHIPRTRSGKITELTVRDIINGKEPQNVTALANPESLEQYYQAREKYLMD